MLIESSFDQKGNLWLLAASFDKNDFISLEKVLDAIGGDTKFSEREMPDKREARKYLVESNLVSTLAGALEGDFDSKGRFQAKASSGQTYACKEVRLGGQGKGCKEFSANDDHAAKVKCGLIANRKRWFGGVAEQGICRPYKRKGLLSWIRG